MYHHHRSHEFLHNRILALSNITVAAGKEFPEESCKTPLTTSDWDVNAADKKIKPNNIEYFNGKE
jgi:hypothetical protein